MVGTAVKVTRQAKSFESYADAAHMALAAAKAEAEAALRCHWESTQCWEPGCEAVRIGQSLTDQVDGAFDWMPDPGVSSPAVGTRVRINGQDHEIIGSIAQRQFGPGPGFYMVVAPWPFGMIAGDAIHLLPRPVCVTASSTVSPADADLKAIAAAQSAGEHLCEYGALPDGVGAFML